MNNELESGRKYIIVHKMIKSNFEDVNINIVDKAIDANLFSAYIILTSSSKGHLIEMIEKPDEISKKLISYLLEVTGFTKDQLLSVVKNVNCFLLLLNTPTKKGWRLTEVTETEEKLRGFEACNTLFKIENPNLDYVRELYPTELELKK